MRPFALLCGVVVLLFGSPGLANAEATSAELQQLVDSYADRRGFNGTVLVAREGKVLLHAAYGKANVEWSVPSRTDARYRIGSLTKPLVATLTMQLVQQGTLRLDGTLGDYLPDLYARTPAASVTVAQLLSHTSGLADMPGRYTDPWWHTAARRSYAPMDFAREWIPPTRQDDAVQTWRYNNNGYFLLGLLIEHVTGQSLAVNLQARIFAPAGMTSSGLFTDTAVLDGLADGYARTPEGTLVHPQRIDPSVSYAAAGIYSTAEDLYRFDRALYGEQLLNAASRQRMLQVHTAAYGFGWNVERWTLANGSTLPVVSHTGSIPGYQSYYLRSEPHQDSVIILSNYWQGALVVAMGKDLMEVLNGKPMQPAARSLDDLLTPIAYRDGLDAMVRAYEHLGTRLAEYDHSEGAFNTLGYRFLRAGRKDEAVRVLEWGVARYPGSANAHDSLGEAYRTSGRVDDARRSYQAALTIEPTSASALAALAELNDRTPSR
ncbi:serine hydrolase [Stenotrophomonas sp. LGBM10]|uniref:serine hydrolase n=1 Tax=Stenotrophomonas sp. LGBM10 TaxID=3390038 RepID=UPI00398AC876